MKEKIIYENADKLTKNQKSSKILLDAFDILKIKKNNWYRKLAFFIIEIFLSIIIMFSNETILVMKDVLELINTVLLAFFAVVFTGYALFQALINDRLLITMIEQESIEKNSKLEESNYYFAEVMMLQFLAILINLASLIILCIVPFEQIIFRGKTIICVILVFLSLYFNFEVIWETKSFIFNVFQLFNAHAISRIIEVLKSQNMDE